MEKISRPLPVPGNVAIRSALLALANLGAELQTYNEENRTIVAQMPKWFGVTKASILVTVQDFGENSRLEIQLPDKRNVDELLNQISLYLVDGHRATGDMTMRWVEKQEKTLAQSAGTQVGRMLGRVKSSTKSAASKAADTDADVVIIDAEEVREDGASTDASSVKESEDEASLDDKPANNTNETPAGDAQVNGKSADASEAADTMPEAEANTKMIVPEFITTDLAKHEIHIDVNPDFFVDRSSQLEACTSCNSVVLRGSQFCGNCGRPVTMEAVSKEVNEGGQNTARSSLIFAGLALFANVVAFYFLLAPTIANFTAETPGPVLPLFNLVMALVFGVIPSLLLGNEARRMAKTADIYMKFRFNKQQKGRTLSYWGRMLGWAAIYINIIVLVFLAIRNLVP